MKNKILITIILSLLAIIIVPRLVFAQDLYVCYTTSGSVTGQVRSVTYGKPYDIYSSDWYGEKTYVKEGSYSSAPPTTYSKYTVYTKVGSNGKCSDKYTSGGVAVTFTYEEYLELKGSVITNGNKFNAEMYKKRMDEKLNSGNDGQDYLEKIKNAYKTVPSNTASESDIRAYISSDLSYNDGAGLEKLSNDKRNAWIQTLEKGMIDNISRKMNMPRCDLLKAYKNNDTEQIDIYKKQILEELGVTIKTNETSNNQKVLYICKTNTAITSSSNSGYTVSDIFYEYIKTTYNNEKINSPGSYGRNSSPKIAPTYGMFNNIRTETIGSAKYTVCSDSYNSQNFDYSRYSDIYNNGGVTDNTITRGQYADYIKQLNESNETHGGGGRDFSDDDDYNQCIDGWWNCAWGFLNKGQNSEHQFGGDGVDDALAGIRSMIFDVGNVIFILVTAFLGVKYIWGGVDSKFSVKNSLMTLVVAAIVFYGWNAVTDILDIQGLLTGNTSASGVDGFVGKVYNTIMYIINFAAVGGIIYIGIRYMMAGADGKAEMKLKGIPIIMGIIMVYGTVNLINFILKIVEGL